MHAIQQFQDQTKSMPKPKKSSVIPSNYSQTFVINFTRDVIGKNEFNNQAKILAEQIETIEESRKLIREGQTMTWNEFRKVHEARRRK